MELLAEIVLLIIIGAETIIIGYLIKKIKSNKEKEREEDIYDGFDTTK